MGIQKVDRPVWVCSDDEEYYDEREAMAHEAMISNKDVIETFLVTQEERYKPKTITLLRDTLHSYEAFKAQQV